ncbi:hypothetical protein UFOVP407_35 [uncultured Caudovirales phage]|uniref:Uncharacterized protein n=1 Tax=uncultured Caudovirales phage TaxID=2100421 RepID=A0A6J5M508_9CAUD|nr:hypothetical protein UFOVP407_35 [uncultured Caudovirales phage]
MILTAILFAVQPTENWPGLFQEWRNSDIVRTEEAPFGTFYDSSGGEWIALDEQGDGVDDYGVLARDFRARRGNSRLVWIRGDHVRDASVSYRTSMVQYRFVCDERRIGQVYWAQYDASGGVIAQGRGHWITDPTIPGTLADGWLDFVCR